MCPPPRSERDDIHRIVCIGTVCMYVCMCAVAVVRIGRVDRSISKIPVKRIVVSILRIEILEEYVRLRTIIYMTLCNQYQYTTGMVVLVFVTTMMCCCSCIRDDDAVVGRNGMNVCMYVCMYVCCCCCCCCCCCYYCYCYCVVLLGGSLWRVGGTGYGRLFYSNG